MKTLPKFYENFCKFREIASSFAWIYVLPQESGKKAMNSTCVLSKGMDLR